MNTYVILRRSGWTGADDLEKSAGICARVNARDLPGRVRWLRTYVVREADGRLGTACVYEAANAATVREHARLAGLPCDTVLPVLETIVMNDDLPPAA